MIKDMKFIIRGGRELSGSITVGGSKNTALKLIAATLIINGTTTLLNVPKITDIERMLEILGSLGAEARWSGHKLVISTSDANQQILPVRISRKLRGSVVFIGPLLARFGKAFLPFPGGCAIGERPLTAHLQLFRECGVRIREVGRGDSKKYSFTIAGQLKTRVRLNERSVTATENAILLGVGLNRKLNIANAAAEPEIDDLIDFLCRAGANIKRLSPADIAISSHDKLEGLTYSIKGDRIEAGTWLAAGALLGKKLVVKGFDPAYLKAPLLFLKKMGAEFSIGRNFITISRALKLRARNLTTAVYPGFPTDLQSPFGLLLTQATGTATVEETLFDNRLRYLQELESMGAAVRLNSPHVALITGPSPLHGTRIDSLDLRAGATMILAGLIARGQTTVNNAEIIDRGYENVNQKLKKVGADIKRID